MNESKYILDVEKIAMLPTEKEAVWRQSYNMIKIQLDKRWNLSEMSANSLAFDWKGFYKKKIS